MCVQRTVNGSEDCLCLGLYSRPWTNPSAKRPVSVTFHGGAFIEGSASFTIPPPAHPVLNVSQANDFIVVYSNYRLNAFGFLPGRMVKESCRFRLNLAYYPILVPIPVVLLPPFQLHTPLPFLFQTPPSYINSSFSS